MSKVLPSSLTDQYGVEMSVSLVIQDLGTFTDILNVPDIVSEVGNGTGVQSLSVELDDTSLTLRNALKENTYHKKACSLIINTVTLFEGELIAPFELTGDHVVQLNMTTVVETYPHGYSQDGVEWPMVFGSPRYVEAARLPNGTTGNILDPFCWVDPKLYENRRRYINMYNQAIFMFLYYDEVRAAILAEVGTPVSEKQQLYLQLIHDLNLIMRTIWEAQFELDDKRRNLNQHIRKDVQAVLDLEKEIETLSLAAAELSFVKEQLEEEIDRLEVLFNREKEATAQQNSWLLQARNAYANYLFNEEEICKQELCEKTQIRIKFDIPDLEPDDGDLNFVVDGIRYFGTYASQGDGTGLFTFRGSGGLEVPQPVYRDLKLQAWAPDDDPCVEALSGMDLIRLDDETLARVGDLTGKYLLIRKKNNIERVRHIIKVKEQRGNKVYLELVRWNIDGTGGPRGQSVESFVNDILTPDGGSSVGAPDYGIFDYGSNFGGFNLSNLFNNAGNPAFNVFNWNTSYRQEVADLLIQCPIMTREELINVVKLIAFRRMDALSQVQFQAPNERDLYTIVGPDVEDIEACASTILPHWLEEFYVPHEEVKTEQIKHDAGARFSSDECTLYALNLIPTTVHALHAYRTPQGGEVASPIYQGQGLEALQPIPSNAYELVNVTIPAAINGSKQDYVATIAKFGTTIEAYGFSGGVYVTQSATVGRNIVDHIEYLTTLGDLTLESSSKAAVKTAIDKYPGDYQLPEGDVLASIQTLATLSRVGIRMQGRQLTLIYLPEKPTPALTVTQADVIKQSFNNVIGNDVITESRGNFQYAATLESSYVLIRNNVDLYGRLRRDADYFIYKYRSLVEKSVQFDILRNSQQFRRVRFRSTSHLFGLEPFDVVTVDSSLLGTDTDIDCLVESVSVNPSDGSCEIILNTTILLGTNVAYDLFWPKEAEGTFVTERRVELPCNDNDT